MTDLESRQAIVDDEHLKLLSVGYVVSGVMTGLFSLMGLVYAGMGLMMGTIISSAARSHARPEELPPEFMGVFFGIFGGLLFLVLVSLAIAKFKAASYIKQRRGRTFCLVIAGISCFGIPYGTCLGVCTFVVLGRQSVVGLFQPHKTA